VAFHKTGRDAKMGSLEVVADPVADQRREAEQQQREADQRRREAEQQRETDRRRRDRERD
jgi:hypothetical protein